MCFSSRWPMGRECAPVARGNLRVMAEDLGGSAQSLAGLAVERGLITPGERDKLIAELRRRAQAGQATSFARLLVGASIPASTVQGLLATGSAYPAVLCESCGQAIPQGMLPERREYPCTRCGCMVLGFSTFLRTPPPRDAEDDANTEEVAALPARPPASKSSVPAPIPAPPLTGSLRPPKTPTPRSVVRLRPPPSLAQSVAPSGPLPPATPPPPGAGRPGVTDRYDEVLPVPEPTTPAGGDGDGEGEGEDIGGRTMSFGDVLRPLPVPPPPPPAEDGEGEDIGGRTVTFDNVFVLPNRRPLSESQVQDEMVTLLGPASSFLGPGAPLTPPGAPSAPSASGPAGPGAPGFDPNAVTVPTGIPALAPRPPAGAPPHPAGVDGSDGERTLLVDMSASLAASTGRPPPAPSPPPLEATLVVPPGGVIPGTNLVTAGGPAPSPGAGYMTPPGVEDTQDVAEGQTLSPTYFPETPTVPPDQVYAREGPHMQRNARPRRTGPRVWPWVLALVLLLGAAATGVVLLLTTRTP